MGEFPLMTEKGTFIYNGAERAIVTQLVRSPGPYFDVEVDKSNSQLYFCTDNPNRGAWLSTKPIATAYFTPELTEPGSSRSLYS